MKENSRLLCLFQMCIRDRYRGAQVFYYGPSERSRGLAASIQQALIEFQDPDNTRQEKANEDYYLLRKETVPTVICECGFMSNAAEEALLKSEMYQELSLIHI